jgi:eukaryotic-like serine/threonine-protein kinase
MSEHGKTRIYSIVGIGPGTQLNGLFEIDEKIASGGMGEVFRGHEIQSGHPIAIKIVLSEFAKDETIVGLFNKEARVLRDFNHPAIVRYMAFGTDPVIGRPYLVMEFVDGPSLSERLEAGPLELAEAKTLFARLASGLDAAHQLGVIHRDISCDNVILANGSVTDAKIIDFGIARTKKGVTLLEGKFAGKYNFVSPEQLGLFNGQMSEATDIYSLGLLMVNALRGVPIDMNGSQLEVIEKRRVVPDISDIDPAIRPIIEDMLQPDPAERKVTMADIAEWFTPVRERSKPPRSRPPIPDASDSLDPAMNASAHKRAEASAKHSPKASQPAAASEPQAPNAKKAASPVKAASSPAEGQTPDVSDGGSRAGPLDAILTASAELNDLADGVPPQTGTGAASTGKPNRSALSEEGVPLPTFHPGVLPGGSARSQSAPPQRPAANRAVALAAAVLALGLGSAFWLLSPGVRNEKNETADAASPNLTPSAAPQSPGQQAKPKVLTEPAAGEIVNTGSGQAAAEPGAETASAQIDKPLANADPAKAAPVSVQQTDPAPKADAENARREWIRGYDGGPCFFARVVSEGKDDIVIEGLGIDAGNSAKLQRDFKARFGFIPKINASKLVQEQCEAARFLSAFANEELPKASLGLDSEHVKGGLRLKGTIKGLNQPNIVLYLLDNEGNIYQFDHLLKRNGGVGSFNIKLVELRTRSPMPQLVMALASDKQVKGSSLSGAVKADAVLPRLAEQIRKDGIKLDFVFSFFLLGGS